MSPPRKVLETVAKLDRFRHKDKDGQGEDGGPSASGMETSTPQTSKVLEAISTCQATLTTKIEEVKVDISLIRQDLHKLRDRVSEAEHRLSHAEVAIPPLQASPDQASHHIAQLQLKQDDLENRMRSNNLHFISFPEGAEVASPTTNHVSLPYIRAPIRVPPYVRVPIRVIPYMKEPIRITSYMRVLISTPVYMTVPISHASHGSPHHSHPLHKSAHYSALLHDSPNQRPPFHESAHQSYP